MATTKKSVSPTAKPHTSDKRSAEFAVMTAGYSGEGKPSSAYSNRGSGGTEFRQVTSTIGNKG